MRIAFPFLVVVALAAPAPALAQGARVMVLVEELDDGARAGAGGGEARLSTGLAQAGYALVEKYDAEQARSRISLDRLLGGDRAGLEVSELHADLLVVARIAVSTVAAPYGITTAAHQARIDLRALQIDSGRIVHAASLSASAPGDFGAAAAKAADLALRDLLPALKAIPAQGEVIEVRVSGLKQAKNADEVAAAIGRVAGVKWTKVRYVSADRTLIEVAAPGLEPAALEGALGRANLLVNRRSAHALDAAVDESAVARRRVAVARFANRTGRKDLDWLEELLPDVFETELVNSKYLVPVPAGRPAIDLERPDGKSVAASGAELFIVGKVDRVGNGLRLSAKAVRASDGAILAAAQLFGTESNASDLGRDLVWKLDAPLYQKLVGKNGLAGYVAPLAKVAPAPAGDKNAASAGPAVRIDSVKLGDLYPALLGYYSQQPLGRVVLRNDGDRRADDLRLEVSLGELSGGVQTLRVGALDPGRTVEVPVKLVLERARLLEVTQRRPARVDLALVDGARRQPFTEPIVLWDRNALDWSNGDAVAAFVTPKDATILGFAQGAARFSSSLPGSLPQAVRTAAALFDAMATVGTRYRRDPSSPYGQGTVDSVQFPRETLSRGGGDCDDLAVLYASLAMAAGLDARLVLTPGHIFVAVDAEVPENRLDRLGGADRALLLDGKAWIPVEITRLDGGFAGAWSAGLAELGRFRGDAQAVKTVDVARAWRLYPPFPLEAPASAPALGDAALERALATDRAALEKINGAPATIEAAAPSSPKEALERATLAAKQGDRDRARHAFQELGDGASIPPPIRAAAWNDLGNVATLEAHFPEARAAYGRALELGADKAQVKQNLAVASYLAGDGQAARKLLQQSGTAESKRLLSQMGLAQARPKPRPATGASETVETIDSADAREGLRGAPGEARISAPDVLIWLQ